MTFNFFLPQKKALVQNIYCSIQISDNKTFVLKTPLRISAEKWDNVKQRPKNIYLKQNKQTNKQLDKIKSRLSQYIRDNKRSVSQKSIYSKLRKIFHSKVVMSPDTLLHHMHYYIDSRKELICSSTYKRYQVFLRLLERFEGFLCQVLYLNNVNANFVRNFILFGKEENYSDSTIYRTLNFVKTVLNFLEKRGVRTFVYELDLPKKKREKRVVTLTEKELIKIKKNKLPNNLRAAKDWLLISCYTGQRVSDFMNFDVTMIKKIEGKSCLSFVQQKTNKNILLPLHPEVCSIIEKNGFSFPPKIPIQTYNTQVKEVVKIAGINHLVAFNKREGHRSVTCLIPKWKAISSHIGRRSFASNFYGKIPTALLMEATGHSTEQMFQRYVSINDSSRVLELGRYFDKLAMNN